MNTGYIYYNDKVIDHFVNPRNVGEVEEPDGVGEVGSLACGDALKLTFKLDENGKIKDAKFKTFGCASAIASSSVLTELIKEAKSLGLTYLHLHASEDGINIYGRAGFVRPAQIELELRLE